jgi:hypothetical protein
MSVVQLAGAGSPDAGSLGFGKGQSQAPGGQAKAAAASSPSGSSDPAQPALPAKEKTWIEKNWYLVLPGAVLVSASPGRAQCQGFTQS